MLKNITSKKTILSNTKIANTTFARFKGLMLEKKENFNYALVFILDSQSRIAASVHMMFVAFPIDIVYLDSQKKVLEIATLQPWILNYTPKKAAKYFIELPQGLGKKVKVGDKLDWK